ncbi:hypothetical protein [Kitasatospora sp. SUK 42]|uniref:hypothetical protein n=1 Tax=Kitasatospora sp. SUK 42 TaxID=1588882 RepID=UPI0018CA9096|nr:hypothetical protein [Kitasatospora sp. SUK 42]MBV2152972.1 hypothetical protein [Kitasatospora sp. SUK 42]
MADNEYDPAGSTQMFRAFVDESPAPQAPGSVSTYSSGGNSGSRTGVIAVIAVVALAVLGAVVWLAVK